MDAQEWLPENSILDQEVVIMAKRGVIKRFNIVEDESGGYYVTMLFNWRPELIHLATRRERDKPRLYMNLGRLVEHIREKYEVITEMRLILRPPKVKPPGVRRIINPAVVTKKPSVAAKKAASKTPKAKKKQ